MNNVLEVSHLTKAYPSFTLEDVSFALPEGAVIGFIGRNGAGKSTTIKSILGMVHPDGGSVLFEGRNVRENEKEFKEKIGVVPGGIDFYGKKKLKTVTRVTSAFYRDWDDETYRKCCKTFELDEEKTVDSLSSGMKVKYLIALALSHRAKLLILDEPTSGLDPVSRNELVELFKTVVRDGKRSILFSTHITSDLEKCASHITFIKNGKIQHTGTINEFMEAYRDKGNTLEDVIIALEQRTFDL
ncbi:MAG: ABC transporter ATP-binding protein [Clostridia bacterium]|nr:ABC transporter ATP-binding protein [Clostridia bacterium]